MADKPNKKFAGFETYCGISMRIISSVEYDPQQPQCELTYSKLTVKPLLRPTTLYEPFGVCARTDRTSARSSSFMFATRSVRSTMQFRVIGSLVAKVFAKLECERSLRLEPFRIFLPLAQNFHIVFQPLRHVLHLHRSFCDAFTFF